jgi:hypothetical protein
MNSLTISETIAGSVLWVFDPLPVDLGVYGARP